MEGEPWDWIPHVEGADRPKEINAYLSRMVEEMPLHKGPMMRWNPATSSMEPFRYDDDQRSSVSKVYGNPLWPNWKP